MYFYHKKMPVTSNLSPSEYYHKVVALFQQKGDPDRAQGQMWYMRYQFEYFGLKAPEWLALAKIIFDEYGIPEGEALLQTARLCYEDDHREANYFGIEMVQKVMKQQPENLIDFFEELIVTKSWWDTVDWLSKLVGMHFQRFPHLTKPVTERWMNSGNIWLQRAAILFQLKFKTKTDTAMLFDYIRRVADSKEFFLQKGAGWALREYSKTDPGAVVQFIRDTPLAPLTKREGMKWIMKNSA